MRIKWLGTATVLIENENDKILLNGKSVGREIRSTRVAENVSTVAKMAVVRHKMVELQQKAAQKALPHYEEMGRFPPRLWP